MSDPIGFIGLGIMGRPMALNLVKSGYQLNVFARRPDALSPFKSFGAQVYDSPKALAADSKIIITVLPESKDVQQVVLGEDGVISGAQPGCVLIDMSSIDPEVTRQLASSLKKQNIDMLDAPVSGGETGAKNASLSIMVGGKSSVFLRMKPILQMMGHCTFVGDHGCGQIAKACNQALVSLSATAVAEVLLLAKAAGADPEKVREALLGGFAASKALEVHGQRMLNGDFKAGFTAKLHAKDIRIVRKLAEHSGIRLALTETAGELFELLAQSNAELDSSAVLTVIEKRVGRQLADKDSQEKKS